MQLKHEEQVISEFLQSLGPWRNVVVISGGYAPIIYKLYLADQGLEHFPVGTSDIDSLVPRKVPKISNKNISRHLREAGFVQAFKDLGQPATESYVKEMNGVEAEIEFLTDSAARIEKHKNVQIAGIVAQPLSYLTLSLEMTQDFQTHSGESGRVVSPGAWMFHKGLTFSRRKSVAKTHKDLYGIWYVATQLGDFSDQAVIELNFLGSQYPKWFKAAQKNLRNWLNHASPLEWSKLEAQDPSGNLKRLSFERIAKEILQNR